MGSIASRLPGYTPKQAERLKHKIEREVAKVEDALLVIRTSVPDCDANRFAQHCGIDGITEEVREIQAGLSETIDRRTRGRH